MGPARQPQTVGSTPIRTIRAGPPVETTVQAPPRRAAPSGARSGILLGAASIVAIGLNYVFLLAAGRILGSDHYGALAALLGLLTVVLMPAGAVQLAVSREVSLRLAVDDEDGAEAFAWAAFRLGLIATAPIVALALALAIPLNETLNIGSAGAVVFTSAALVTALAFPIAMGVLQGYQRFHAVAAMYVVPFAVRLALLTFAAFAGFVLGGAVFAIMAAAVVGAVAVVVLVREPLRRGARMVRPALGPFLRYLWPVFVGLIGIALLTTVDLLVVKARFSPGTAGEYAAASAFARVAFFLPATILTVLFPRTAARQARGEDTEDILGRSLLVAAAFGALLALFYGLTGRGLVQASFGGEFAAGGELLVLFTISMTLFSLANVLVGFHLSRNETRFAWIVASAVPVQIALLALVPSSAQGVILTDIVVGTALLAAHELFVDSSVPALHDGLRHFAAEAASAEARRVVKEGLVVFLAATALVAVLFWPVIAHFGSTIIGTPGSDSTGSVWWFWRAVKEGGYHLLGTTHHTLTGAPFGWDEGNGLNAQWLLPYYPTYLMTKVVGEIAAYNVAVLSGYVFSGVAMYALVRYLRCSVPVSAWAGIAFVVFPWHLARAEHASLVHLEVIVLLLLTLVAAGRAPSFPRYALVGAATLACWLTSGYFGTMAVITTVAFTVGAALTMAPRRGVSLALGSTVAAVAGSGLVGIAAVLSGTGRAGGLERMVGDLSAFGLRLRELVVPSPGNLLVGDRLETFYATRLHGSNVTEASNYIGLLTMALAFAWVFLAIRRRAVVSSNLRSATAGLVAASSFGLLFGLPSPASLFGQHVWMPSRLVWEVTPAFRVPSRWIVVVMAAIVPLAALGLQSAWRALAGRGSGAQYALVTAAIAISFLELTINPAERRFRTEPLPPEYAAVERAPPGILADYPLGSSDLYLLWQRRHGRPLLNGAPAGTPADDARRVLLDPASPGVASTLALLGVTAIVIHPSGSADVEVAPRNPTGADGFSNLARLQDGTTVWRVAAAPAPALVTLTGGFAPPVREENGAVGYALLSPAGVGTLEFTARTGGVVRLVFEATPPSSHMRVLRLSDTGHESSFELNGRTQIAVTVAIPRGRSLLEVKTDPAATSIEDAVVLGVPRAERASGAPALHAQPISSNPGF
jgi:O-antigen/teichoic acid export membrane protein